MAKKTSTTFESILSQLENIVNHLESGELPLNEALKEFEKGIQLTRLGQQQLQEAEQRIQILLANDHNNTLTPFKKDEEN